MIWYDLVHSGWHPVHMNTCSSDQSSCTFCGAPHKFVSTPTSFQHRTTFHCSRNFSEHGSSIVAEPSWSELSGLSDSPWELPSWPIPCQVDWRSAQVPSVLHLISLLLLQGWDEADVSLLLCGVRMFADSSWLELKDLLGTWLSTANLRVRFLTNGQHKCCLPCRLSWCILEPVQSQAGIFILGGPAYQQQIWR